MIKRAFDFIVSSLVLLVFGWVILLFMLLVWLQDFRSPLYKAPRVGKNGKMFNIIKLRSMVVNADKIGGSSTSAEDRRITKVGRIIRKYKLDELTQFWNVFVGQMSMVGPRPQIMEGGVDLYTGEERRMLSVRPGITDMASIVFSDEGDILKDCADPDLGYQQLIRPWKSRLSLLCVDKRSLSLDMKLILLTAVAILDKEKALAAIQGILTGLNADPEVRRVSLRKDPLVPAPPPGTEEICTSCT